MAIVISEGTKVTWQGHKGVVKALHPHDQRYVYVVFKCSDNWDKYKDYTSQRVLLKQLKTGWPDDPDTNASKLKYDPEKGTWKNLD